MFELDLAYRPNQETSRKFTVFASFALLREVNINEGIMMKNFKFASPYESPSILRTKPERKEGSNGVHIKETCSDIHDSRFYVPLKGLLQ